MVQMVDAPRQFTPPRSAPQLQLPESAKADIAKSSLPPIPPTFKFLREINNPRSVYPWNDWMASRPDLVEGVNDTMIKTNAEREQDAAMDILFDAPDYVMKR